MPEDVQEAGIKSQWTIWFQTQDTDQTAQKAIDQGATVAFPPTDIPKADPIPGGRVAFITDTQEAGFGIVTR